MKLVKQTQLVDEKLVEELNNKTVSVIGLGGVGSSVIEALARNSINLRLVDKERVYEQEIPRQTLYTKEDISKFKAKQAKKLLENITENIQIKSFHEELHEDNMFLLKADVIIDASNNIKTSLLVNKYALENKIPLITISYSKHKGHVLVVDKQQEKKGPCLKCLEEEFDTGMIKKEGVYSPITQFISSIVINETLKELLDVDMETTLLKVDALKNEIRHSQVEKKRGCAHCKGK
ncbi:MAG: HesA/MoeB/ThiF family protein [Nanobdellota archaeon]